MRQTCLSSSLFCLSVSVPLFLSPFQRSSDLLLIELLGDVLTGLGEQFLGEKLADLGVSACLSVSDKISSRLESFLSLFEGWIFLPISGELDIVLLTLEGRVIALETLL